MEPAEERRGTHRPVRVGLRPVGDDGWLAEALGDGDCVVVASDPDCVVVHDSPTVDAVDVVERRAPTDPPVVVVASDPDVCRAALRAGAADVVHVPATDGEPPRPTLLADRIAAVVADNREGDDGRRRGDVFDDTDEGLVVHDAETGEALEINDTLYELLGYDPDADADDVGLTDLLSDEAEFSIGEARERVKRVAEGGPETFEWLNETKDGERLWVEVRLEPVTLDGHERVLAHVRDVSERKRSERALDASEEQLHDVLARVSDGFFAVDESWTITYVNERFEELLGREREAVLGENLWEEFPEAVTELFYEKYHEAMAAQTTMEFEEFFEPLETWFAVRAYPSPDGLSVYFRDVTETRERERELRVKGRAMDKAAVPLTLSDPEKPDNPLVYVNDAFCELTGYDREDVLGRNCRFLQGPETDPETVEQLREAIDAEESVEVDVRNYRADGTTFWNRLTVAPIEDETGEVIQFIGSQRDVTAEHEREAMFRSLLETTRQLFEADSTRELAEMTVDAVADIVDCEAVSIRQHDPETGTLIPVAVADRTLEHANRESLPEIAVGDSVIGRVFEAGESTLRRDVERASDHDYGDIEAALVVPLGDHGTLNLGVTDTSTLDDGRRDIVELLATNATAALDQTDREQELQEYETLFETIRDMLYVLDDEGRFRFVSPRLAERVGHDRTDLVGEPATTILSEETADRLERRVFEALLGSEPEADAGGGERADADEDAGLVLDGELVTADDERLPVEIELSFLPHEESFRGTVCSVRDVSERRRRERELRVFQQAVDDAGIGLVMYDERGRFRYVNDHYASVLGYDRETLSERRVWELDSSLDAAGFDSMWESFELGETRARETVHRRSDGTTVPVETVMTAVGIDGTRYHVGTVQQVAGRKERREQTAVLHRILRHNIRNDLSIVIGHAEMLAERLDDDEDDDSAHARTIADTARGISDLADTAQQVESTLRRDIVRRPLELVEPLRELLEPFRGREDVVVETDLPDEQVVYADTTLVRAIEQLLSNAIEHNDRPVASVEVSVSESETRSGWVDIEVADDGPGIPEHERTVLTGGTETALEHGSGLGLWVVYWVVTRSGGDLTFVEDDAGGSRVRISLPSEE